MWHLQREILTQPLKASIKLEDWKNTESDCKEEGILQGRHTDGQHTHERCSGLLTIREMPIETAMRYHSHRSEGPLSKSLQTKVAGEGVEKMEPSCTVGGNVNWYSHYGEQYGDLF